MKEMRYVIHSVYFFGLLGFLLADHASAFEILSASDTPQMIMATPEVPAQVETKVSPVYDHTVYRDFDVNASGTTAVSLPPSDPTKPIALHLDGLVVRSQAELTNFATDPSLVTTGAELEGFVIPRIKADPRIVTVRAAGGAVEVVYSAPVSTFFGYWKTELPITARIDKVGLISIERPWYGFLFSSEIEPARLSAQVTAYASTTPSLQGERGGGVLESEKDIPSIRMARNFLHLANALQILSEQQGNIED